MDRAPTRSPDVTPLYSFLYGYVNSLIYETPVESDDFHRRIVVAAGKIAENPRVFEHVRQSILKRYKICIEVGGGIIGAGTVKFYK